MTYASAVTSVPFDQKGHRFTLEKEIKLQEVGGELVVFDHLYECDFCGAWARLEIQASHVSAKNSCAYPEGLTTVINLSVPSGKIIVLDDLRPIYDVDDSKMASYNSALGRAQYTKAMETAGCAYGAVGNTSPGLYKTGEDTYLIASPGYNEEADAYHEPGEFLLSIITDLWAYSIADFEDWKARGGDESALPPGAHIVEIPAGVYQFTHHYNERDFKWDTPGTAVFTDIKKIA